LPFKPGRSKEREEQAQRFGALTKCTLKARKTDQTERLFEHQIQMFLESDLNAWLLLFLFFFPLVSEVSSAFCLKKDYLDCFMRTHLLILGFVCSAGELWALIVVRQVQLLSRV